jgi:hypothetical protein
MNYLEIKANEWAKKKALDFDKKVLPFKIQKEYTQQECINIYKTYKENCLFDNLLKVSYLFEKNNEQYNKLLEEMNDIIDRNVFKNLYINSLGNIYNKVFKKSFEKLSLVEKIDDANKQIINLKKCIYGRVQFHFNCKQYNIKYNEPSHRHEILISIYMYNRVKDIQVLLNKFKKKHTLFKEQLIKNLQDTQKIINDFENISLFYL